MKKMKLLLILCLILFCVSSCGDIEKNIDMNMKDNQNFKGEYSDKDLQRIANYKGTLDEYNKVFPFEYKDTTEDGNIQVIYVGNKKVAVIIFDEEGNNPDSAIFGMNAKMNLFEQIKPDDDIDKVMKIDPDGDYLFLYVDNNSFPLISTHYSVDRYIINIYYTFDNEEKKYIVKDKKIKKMQRKQ